MKTYIVSHTKTDVYIILTDDARKHIKRHFKSDVLGSKFNIGSPEELLQIIVDVFPEEICKTTFNKYNCKEVSVSFPDYIGDSNVVPLSELSKEELSTLRITQRGENFVRSVISSRVFLTKECQLILDADNHVVTVYPGELAPPLPDSPDIHDEYWDNHVFIEPKA